MKSTKTTSIQQQQTKYQFANPQQYLNYELGHAVKRLPPIYMRLLGFGVCTLVVSTIAWAALSKVDEVATATGQVVPASQIKPMRSLATGMLREINVKEGMLVKKGDILLELDPTISQAEVKRLEKLAEQNRAALARLEAERNGTVQAGSVLQNELLESRLKEFRDRQAAATADANRQLGIIKASQVKKTQLESELAHTSHKLQAMGTLASAGAVPRFDYLDLQNKVDSLQKQIAIQVQEIEQAQQAYQAAQKNMTRLKSERQTEILSQIDKQQQELTDLEGKLSQAKEQHKQSIIRASVTGTVYDIKVAKTGATVQAGDELLSIVPQGETLMLEAKVQNRDIGFIKQGMYTKVKLETFPYQEFGILQGTIDQISPNAIPDKDLGLVFPVSVKLKQQTVHIKGREVPLSPGMTSTVEIVTRQKTVLSFLLEPITASLDRAFSVR
ncbi:HlyD family type I secretion periplasmic adaptor subunit [Leptodesmis sichuanensis]|uniref:HlyD family type I secretion periplasmic adaptor subunit n=1 Tax=Leptodesmis sichuanensis TaxID=2906798 RepID=UPI001F2BD3F2|nr:HlyD family type I secretion periplasmic adaptor subunit [Leptodesmis sichuanensis]UIE38140.1 HlyD family type I secretion periplasmic adaptor subunit [Leptodesmis sichuanensis A121]